ncbi:MAG: uracil phosphoribosyltransferase [Planctomycetaceae bacterium]|jgi:uracil phosphoribosyltransferase|nr:uracil phosphoribosyltransferase [Planctomycetaceae bacterium]MBT7254400.1 uracil phosphoribosyltransferase [Planctomycetaceae bacterium]MBT7918355.1 uracil phosphoribosyltransferase [Planctomycetaceae bacterium]
MGHLYRMGNVVELQHAVLDHYMTIARERCSTTQEFRAAFGHLGQILAVEMTKNIAGEAKVIETPLEATEGFRMHTSVAIVPILRAGLALVDPFVDLLPKSVVIHLGMYRNEETAKPIWYYNKLDEQAPVARAIILDPMLATGGSVVVAVEALRNFGIDQVEVGCVIAAPEGIHAVQEFDGDVDLTICKIDDRLDENCFIRPGLGDAGDRYFGTA